MSGLGQSSSGTTLSQSIWKPRRHRGISPLHICKARHRSQVFFFIGSPPLFDNPIGPDCLDFSSHQYHSPFYFILCGLLYLYFDAIWYESGEYEEMWGRNFLGFKPMNPELPNRSMVFGQGPLPFSSWLLPPLTEWGSRGILVTELCLEQQTPYQLSSIGVADQNQPASTQEKVSPTHFSVSTKSKNSNL